MLGLGLGNDEIVGCAAMQPDIVLVKHEVTKIEIRVGCLTGLKISVAIDILISYFSRFKGSALKRSNT